MPRKTPKFGHDVTCGWCRKYLCYLSRAGIKKALKNQINRWERHEIRRAIREGSEDL